MLLYNEEDEYICSTVEPGFKLLVHNSTYFPFVENIGYNIPTGFLTSISLTQVRINDDRQ